MSTDFYPQRGLDGLSARERQVLIHLMHGLSACEIAALDYVTIATVRSQIRSILWKLRVNTQLAAVAHAYAACWPTDDDRRQVITQALTA